MTNTLRPFSVVLLSVVASALVACPNSDQTLTITTNSLAPAYLNLPYDQALDVDGGVAPYAWALLDAGSSAPWLSIEPASGRLFNTTLPSSAPSTPSDLLVKVTDSKGATAQKQLTLDVLECQGTGISTCFVSSADSCARGDHQCLNGHATACADPVPSNDPTACGPNCNECGEGANACNSGKCACGNAAGCDGGICCGAGAGGTCVDGQNDPLNCGACGASCASQSGEHPHTVAACHQGACDFTQCAAGFGRCGAQAGGAGCDTDLTQDNANCGACGNACPAVSSTIHVSASSCSSSTCNVTCSGEFANCDGIASNGCETSTATTDHCGSCTPCPPLAPSLHAVPTCTGAPRTCQAVCQTLDPDHQYASCGRPYDQGCPINIASDVNNCGYCGHSCPPVPNKFPGCSRGSCVYYDGIIL